MQVRVESEMIGGLECVVMTPAEYSGGEDEVSVSVFVFHGHASNPDSVSDLPALLAAEDDLVRRHTRFVLPAAPHIVELSSNNRSWWQIEVADFVRALGSGVEGQYGVFDTKVLGNACRELLGCVGQWTSLHPSDRVIFCGFSQGAWMALQCGLITSQRVDLIFMWASPFVSPGECRRVATASTARRILLINCESDQVVPMLSAVAMRNLLVASGQQAFLHRFPGHHEIASDSIRLFSAELGRLIRQGKNR